MELFLSFTTGASVMGLFWLFVTVLKRSKQQDTPDVDYPHYDPVRAAFDEESG